MEIFVNKNATVEKVVDGVAIVTLRIPVDLVDEILSLADNIIHFARFLKYRSKSAPGGSALRAVPGRFDKVIG